jgi:ribose-phosphate pyrophosphokinase
MFALNLDSNFTPYNATALPHKTFTFYGGEPHIKIEEHFDTSQIVTITHRLGSFNALGEVCVAANALRCMGVTRINLCIPYFPGARQDRVMVPGEPLTVKVYANIINSLRCNKVIVFDPHSDVAPALLDNVQVISNHAFISRVLQLIGSPVKLVAPDGGALKKIYKLSAYLGVHNVTECGKSRDVATGKLGGFKVYEDDLAGADCLIVDDISDGGGTFIGLAEALRAKNAGKLYLAVSHGIFSKGFDVLAQSFETIFTTNSFRDLEHPAVKQIQLSFD